MIVEIERNKVKTKVMYRPRSFETTESWQMVAKTQEERIEDQVKAEDRLQLIAEMGGKVFEKKKIRLIVRTNKDETGEEESEEAAF